MAQTRRHTGYAIALAWPQTYCKQPGAWYDGLMFALKVNKNNYYKVGHSAIVLINIKKRTAKYYDFGRYHAPFQHGRVRSAKTDFDLKLKTKPVFSGDSNKLENYDEILKELQSHAAFHGEGNLEASLAKIDIKKSSKKAKQMQEEEFITYGPFVKGGSNCSRFVHTVLNAGVINKKEKFKLNWNVPLTPTPMSNVNAFSYRRTVAKFYTEVEFNPLKRLSKKRQITTLNKPKRPENIPNTAQWISGEGAGSWFFLDVVNNKLKAIRYSAEGYIECEGFFQNKRSLTKKIKNYQLTYPSNCRTITLLKKDKETRFERVSL